MGNTWKTSLKLKHFPWLFYVILTYQPIAREATKHKGETVKPLTSTMVGMIWGWAKTYGIRWK